MIKLSPYQTTYGEMVNTSKLVKDLVKYLASTRNTNLNYEFQNTSECKLVFILGIDQEEKDLPLWEHPLVLKDLNNNNVVAVDLRKFVKKIDEQPMSVTEIIKDPSSVNFLIVNALTTMDYVDGNFGYFRDYTKAMATSFSYVVSHLVNSIVGLNPVEKVYVEIVLAHYVNMLLSDTSDKSDLVPSLIARISNMKLSIPVNKKSVEVVMGKINHDVSDIDDLMDNIKIVLPEEKRTLIDVNALINVISNIWYGPGNSETIVISLEHLPTWLTLVYTSIADKGFKRTRLAMMLDKFSRQIGSKEFEKDFGNYVKERTIVG